MLKLKFNKNTIFSICIVSVLLFILALLALNFIFPQKNKVTTQAEKQIIVLKDNFKLEYVTFFYDRGNNDAFKLYMFTDTHTGKKYVITKGYNCISVVEVKE